MEEISKLDSKINAIEFALESFARANNKDARKLIYLENGDTVPYLKIYFTYSKEQLHHEKKQLQTLKQLEQQLLEIEIGKAKQRSTTEGN